MKRVLQQIMSILLAFTLLFAVSGHQLLYHICHQHGIHNVTFSFFVQEAVNHCTCFGCHHHEAVCCDHSDECEHHHHSEQTTVNDTGSCCDMVSKLLKITNPFQNEQKVQLPLVAVMDCGSTFSGNAILELLHSFFNHQIWDDLPNGRWTDLFQKSFLFTQFLF